MKLLITGAWNVKQEQIESLQQQGHEIVFLQNETDGLPANVGDIEGVICNGLFLNHPIELFSSLRYIQLTSAGYDRVPMDYIKEHNICIHNARGVYNLPMAEFALCGVLQLYKQSRFFMNNQLQHRWEKHRGILELSGRTVCVVGCGNIGETCARLFSALGCSLIGIDPVPYNGSAFEKVFALEQSNEALSQADIIILCLPLTAQTHHFVGQEFISQCKQGAILVNIARGAVVETDALVEALHKNLGGAVLDVFEDEPLLQDCPLWNMENVIITPHNSFVGDNNSQRLTEVIMNNLYKEEFIFEETSVI